MKRDCVFLLADKNMRASFEGFFSRSSAIYRKITAQVSVNDCCDDAFLQLAGKLREWFPPDPG